MKFFNRYLNFFLCVVPLIIWLGLSRWGNVASLGDNSDSLCWASYYFHHLMHGVSVVWDPFRAWGWPEYLVTQAVGAFNPLYVFYMISSCLGFSEQISFQVYLISYFCLGQIGFFFLSRRLLNNRKVAFLAYLLFLYSLFSLLLFSQLWALYLLFTPIWFFLFIIDFFRADNALDRKKGYVGIIFTLILAFNSYMPFYFLIITGLVFFFQVVLSFDVVVRFFSQVKVFFKESWATGSVGIGIFFLSVVPGALAYLAFKNKEFILSYSRTTAGRTDIDVGLISLSGLPDIGSLEELISSLHIPMAPFTHISIFILVLLALAGITRLHRKALTVLLTASIIFLIAVTNAAPVHAFLYANFHFFRMFRNLYYIGPVVITMLIVFGAMGLEQVLKLSFKTRFQRAGFLVINFLIHSGFIFWFVQTDMVEWGIYATVLISLVLFSCYGLGLFNKNMNVFWLALYFLALFHPVMLHCRFMDVHHGGRVVSIEVPEESFKYVRPLQGENPGTEIRYPLALKRRDTDASGFISDGAYGTPDTYRLRENISSEDLGPYVKYKFILYDKLHLISQGNEPWLEMRKSFRYLQNQAFVYDSQALNKLMDKKVFSNTVITVESSGPNLTVDFFNPHRVRLRTNLLREKFLVYNDGYDKRWQAFIDGIKVPIYQSNVAFKGVWVPAGERTVEFRYGSLLGGYFRFSLIWIFLLWGVQYFFISLWKKVE